jgi:hypothetical protein
VKAKGRKNLDLLVVIGLLYPKRLVQVQWGCRLGALVGKGLETVWIILVLSMGSFQTMLIGLVILQLNIGIPNPNMFIMNHLDS